VTEARIILTIEKLAGLGDGMGVYQERKVYVPYTFPGDKVAVRIVKDTKDALYGTLEEILSPGKGRMAPECRHFSACGGCSLQHIDKQGYADFKQEMARAAVRKAGYEPDLTAPMIPFPAASRRRAELKVKDGKLGYFAQNSHHLVDIEECKVLEPALFALIKHLKGQLHLVPGVTDIQINGVDEGYDVLLDSKTGQGGDIAIHPSVRRLSMHHDDRMRTLFQSGPVTVTFDKIMVEVPPAAFLQASRAAQSRMTALVMQAVGDAETVLDLFAGIGTYGFPLSARAEVTAIEGSRPMVTAMREAAKYHQLGKRFTADMRDLFKNPLSANVLSPFDAVIINPPRSGAKAQCEQLALSKVSKIIMVSCNPATFSRDARLLKEGGYDLKRAIPIDQFVYSSHLELIAEFTI